MILDRIENGLKSVTKFIDTSESIVINVISKLSPWAAPLPTAYLVYSRTILHLEWPVPVAAIAAIAIEALGLATTSTTLQLYRYNKTRKKIPADWEPTILASGRKSRYRGRVDPAAPTWIPATLTILYVVVAEGLTVVLDIATKWGSLTAVDLAPAVFPLLSIAGMALLAVQADHTQRLADIEETKKPKPKVQPPKPKLPVVPDWAAEYQCWCGWWPGKKENATSLPEHHAQMIGGHTRRHYREAKASESILKALAFYKETYPDALSYPDGTTIAKWRKDDITS